VRQAERLTRTQYSPNTLFLSLLEPVRYLVCIRGVRRKPAVRTRVAAM
jgi:hypothetical protein